MWIWFHDCVKDVLASNIVCYCKGESIGGVFCFEIHFIANDHGFGIPKWCQDGGGGGGRMKGNDIQ